ncbi:MAG: hypothetical protein A2W31_02865 [Planctomycetes bacterium RBG_16_64_10]|nr:MAG: hypothetical protein A2W31_02865 [Planctomycetes bacterium RBG_16_64_10]
MFVLPLAAACALAGCTGQAGSNGTLEKVWGRHGIAAGRLQKPRAMAIDEEDRLYIVDMTARIQVFDGDGTYLRGWRTPTCQNGRPSGLTIGRDGLLLVADTHYFQVLFYTPDGQLLAHRTIGGTAGVAAGQFGLVTDAVQDSLGNIYISEYGAQDRVQKFSSSGQFLLEWGGHGARPGQFVRPQNLAIDHQDQVWVADACNHRIQVFDGRGRLLRLWGVPGRAPGALYYPYDLALDHRGHLYVCEFGNHRVQKFTLEGRSLGCWGTNGRGAGQLHNPWALVCDRRGRVHVLDTNNHRVQRVRL